jgi:hypothetical protein
MPESMIGLLVVRSTMQDALPMLLGHTRAGQGPSGYGFTPRARSSKDVDELAREPRGPRLPRVVALRRRRVRVVATVGLVFDGELEVVPDDVRVASRIAIPAVQAGFAVSRERAAAGPLSCRSREPAVAVSRLAAPVAPAVEGLGLRLAWTIPRYQAGFSDAHRGVRRCTLAQPRRASAGLGRHGPLSLDPPRR